MLHRDSRQRRSTFLVLVTLSILLVYSLTRPASVEFFSNSFGYILEPIAKLGNNTVESTASTGNLFRSKADLVAENESLKEDILSMSMRLVDHSYLEEENRALKSQMGRDDEDKRVLATILTRTDSSPYGTVLLDIGTDNGVIEGDLVVVERAVFGRIVRATQTVSLMLPFSAPGEKNEVLIGGNEVISAVAQGRGGGTYMLELPRDTDVQIGDEITLPGLYPFFVGTIEHVDLQSNDPFKFIFFKAPAPLAHLRYVEVVLGTALPELDETAEVSEQNNEESTL